MKIRPLLPALALALFAAGASAADMASAGRGGRLLPDGYLKTQGSQIVDRDGHPVRIAGVGWAGTEAPGGALQGLWRVGYETVLDSIKADGFNAVRLPWTDAGLYATTPELAAGGAPNVDYAKGRNAELRGLTLLQSFQALVAYAGKIGLKVIIDHHSNEGWTAANYNGLWFDLEPGYIATDGSRAKDGALHEGRVTQAAFFANWLAIAKTFAGNSTVIGYDLDNEPSGQGNMSKYPMISWGVGDRVDGRRVNDIKAMYETLGNLLQAVDAGPLIICEGPGYAKAPPEGYGFDPKVAAPEGDLTGVRAHPVTLKTPNKVVYSVHEYPTEIDDIPGDSGPGLVARMNAAWGYLVSEDIAPIYVGEFGSSMLSEDAQPWAATLVSYLNGRQGALGGPIFPGARQPISASWWSVGRNDGTPDGTQYDWGIGYWRPEVQAITDQVLFGAPPIASPDGLAVDGLPGTLVDAAGNLWALAGGKLSINGIADPSAGEAKRLVFAKGAVWARDARGGWRTKASPAANWVEGAGPFAAMKSATLSLAGGAGLLDGEARLWSLRNGQVVVDGRADPAKGFATMLLRAKDKIWRYGLDKRWRAAAQPGGPWTPSDGEGLPPLPASAEKTQIAAPGAPIVDPQGNVWGLLNGQVALNGAIDGWSWGVSEIAFAKGQVWQKGGDGLWRAKAGAAGAWAPAEGQRAAPF